MRTRSGNILIMLIVFPLAALTLLPTGTIVVSISYVSPSAIAVTPPAEIAPDTQKILTESSSVSVTVVVVSGESKSVLPNAFSLSQNYPNPFNPVTEIRFGLPRSGRATLKIYDLLGREIATLFDEVKAAGYQQIQWNGQNKQGSPVPSGVYIYRLISGNHVEQKKMLLIK